jgi:Pyruvate/2-oxoacid:ferredoxin oxidoreductase delta subunit
VRDISRENPTITFVCRTHLRNGGAPGGCQRVECLGRLDESILVGAVAWGAKEVLLVDGSCAQCRSAGIHGGIQKTVERSIGLLQAFGVQARISLVADVPSGSATGAPAASGVSRRDFFSLFAGRARQTGAAEAEPILDSREDAPEGGPLKPGELPVYLPLKRRLLLAALGRLEGQGSPSLNGEEGFWTSVSITTNCNGCRMCAVFCPTGALAKTEADGKPAISFRSSHCTGCLLCRDICLWKAVRISTDIDTRSALGGTTVSTLMPLK